MTDRLEEIRQRAEAATPGPWVAYGNTVDQEKTGWHQVVGTELTGLPYMTYERLTTKNEDATFIAHAREDIPYLLAEAERLRIALASVGYRLTRNDDGSDHVYWVDRKEDMHYRCEGCGTDGLVIGLHHTCSVLTEGGES